MSRSNPDISVFCSSSIVAGLGEDDEVIIILRWLEKILIIYTIMINRWFEKYFYSHSFHISWAKVGVGGDELGG